MKQAQEQRHKKTDLPRAQEAEAAPLRPPTAEDDRAAEPVPRSLGPLAAAAATAAPTPAATLAGATARATPASRLCGRYELVRLLGRGGMGEVWLGRHTLLGRFAAVKVIRPEAIAAGSLQARTTLVRRFEREARATARLRSPQTIQIYDYGTTADGTFYYAMELLDGISLQELIEKHGALPPERVIYLLRQLCDSLAEAHEQGLVHRDIKPSNIFACRLGLRADFIKVLDFGLVKMLPGEEPAASLLTTEGVTAGSPAFMAPETVKGSERLDERSDIYALGCLAYWLLSGKLVFEGETALEMIVAHVERRPPPVGERSTQTVPTALEALVMQCLAKNPGERPQSVREVARRLGECARSLGRRWGEEEAEAWWREHMPPQEQVSRESDTAPAVAALLTEEERLARARAYRARLEHHFTRSHVDIGEYERRLEMIRHAQSEAQLQAALDDLPRLQDDASPAGVAPADAAGVAGRAAATAAVAAAADASSVVGASPTAGATTSAEQRPPAVEDGEDPREGAGVLKWARRQFFLDEVAEAEGGPNESMISNTAADARPGAATGSDALVVQQQQPLSPPATHKQREEVVFSLLGTSVRRGRWRPSRLTKAISILGQTTLDFRDAELPPGVTRVTCVAVLGETKVIVPPGVAVEADGAGILGDFGQMNGGCDAPVSPDQPILRLTGLALLGSVQIVVNQRTKALPPHKDR